jgi:hypothetical protein
MARPSQLSQFGDLKRGSLVSIQEGVAIGNDMQSESRFEEEIGLRIDLIGKVSRPYPGKEPSIPPNLLITSLWISRIFSEVRIMNAVIV